MEELLSTKLFIPSIRSELVSRPRLTEKLNEGLGRKLTLISAPAGFGKTTLISEWVAECEQSVAWLSLDQGDNDLNRFLTYLIAALQTIDPKLASETLSALHSPQPPPSDNILISLINAVAALPDKITLILDDYQLIEAQPIHDALDFILEKLPPQLHLVIATREDPLLSLPRLRVREQLTELRAAELRFSSSEAAEFLNQVMGLNLTEKDIAALESRTEGWIAGLQLAAISMQGREDANQFIQSFTGSNRLVLDYLIEEVLNQQSEEIQDFLLQTSIVDRLSNSLCNAIVKTENSQQILEKLEHTNLFVIPLDNERQWYRYHHLFADLLRQRLLQTQPDLLPILHQRASAWFADQGLGEAAIDHALQGEDYAQAAALIDQNVGGNYEQISSLILQRWLAAFPPDMIYSQPQLCLLQAWNQFTSGQLAAADEGLQTASELLETEEQLSNLERNALTGRASAIRSFIASYSGNLPGAIEFAQQALEVLPTEEAPWRSAAKITLGNAYAEQGRMDAAHKIRSEALEMSKSSGEPFIQMIAQLNLAETIWQQGNVKQVSEICARQAQLAEKQGLTDSTIMGWLYGLWGEALAEQNQLDKGLEYTQKGVKLAEARQDVIYICYSKLHRARVLFSAGKLGETETVIKKMEQAASDSDFPQWATSQIAAWQVRIWLSQGDLDAAANWVNNRGLKSTDEYSYVQEPEYIALARVRLALGALSDVHSILDRSQTAAELGGRDLRRVEVGLLQALTAHTDGNLDQALTFLEPTLRLAQAKGIIQIFVDEGPPAARLLYEAVNQEIEPEYAQSLLATFPIETTDPVTASKSETEEWVEPLSERELEVLNLIAEGLSNREVGERLYLTANTVKAHARTIYGKLGVNNRTQAVGRARALGLISNS